MTEAKPARRAFPVFVAIGVCALGIGLAVSLLRSPSPDVLYDRAFALFKEGKHQDALPLLRTAIGESPEHAEAHNLLGCCQLKLHEPEKAIASFEEATRLKPDLAEAYRNLGVAFMQIGRAREAIGAYKAAHRLDSADDLTCFNLGVAYQRMGLLQLAKEAYGEALKTNPKSLGAQYNLGVVYLKLERWKDARKAFHKAVELHPNDGRARYNLVMSCAHLGDREAAMQQYRILKAIDPELAAKLMAHVSKKLDESNGAEALPSPTQPKPPAPTTDDKP